MAMTDGQAGTQAPSGWWPHRENRPPQGPTSADEKAAAVIREKYDYYLDFGRPIEEDILGSLFSPEEMDRQVFESRGLVSKGFDSARLASTDYRSRYGTIRTPEEAAFEERKRQITQALAETEAADQTRGVVTERDINTATDLTRIGQGFSSSAQQGLTQSAASEASREAANEANASSKRASAVGLAAGAGGLAYALGATNPVIGLAAGAGLALGLI